MTSQEIQELAGHRDVPSWVIKLVGDAIAKEREACAVLVENADTPDGWSNVHIAEAIRARGNV